MEFKRFKKGTEDKGLEIHFKDELRREEALHMLLRRLARRKRKKKKGSELALALSYYI